MKMPILYHPTKLYWVDDDKLFLDVVTDRFDKYAISVSLSSMDTLNAFQTYQSCINALGCFRGCDEIESYDLVNQLPVSFDFNSLRRHQKNNKRFDEVAVMIVDYRMPEMNGIDLCKKLSMVPAKKILLTGDADLKEAINALNEGIIDCFISKDDPNIDSILIRNVDRLTQDYFLDRTAHVFNHILSDINIPQSDPVFIDFFQKLCAEEDIIEYILSDKNGGMLLGRRNGDQLYFILHTEKSLDDFSDLHSDNGDAEIYIKSILERNKIPFFGVGEEMWGRDLERWADCFYEPKIFNGRERYYYALSEL